MRGRRAANGRLLGVHLLRVRRLQVLVVVRVLGVKMLSVR